MRLTGKSYAENIEIAQQALLQRPGRPYFVPGADGRPHITPVKFAIEPGGFPEGYEYKLELTAKIVVMDAFEWVKEINPSIVLNHREAPEYTVLDTLFSAGSHTWEISFDGGGKPVAAGSPLSVEFPFEPTPTIPNESHILMNLVVFVGSLTTLKDGKTAFLQPLELASGWGESHNFVHPSSGWTYTLQCKDGAFSIEREPNLDYPSTINFGVGQDGRILIMASHGLRIAKGGRHISLSSFDPEVAYKEAEARRASLEANPVQWTQTRDGYRLLIRSDINPKTIVPPPAPPGAARSNRGMRR